MSDTPDFSMDAQWLPGIDYPEDVVPSTRAFVTENDQLLLIGPAEESLRESFERFDRENPHVYRALRKLAFRWHASHPGRPCGIGMLYEVARWTVALQPTVGEPVKLNNNYRAFYARKLMDEEPELVGLFSTRRQRVEP